MGPNPDDPGTPPAGGETPDEAVHRYAIASDELPSTALATAVCDVKGVDPDVMDPLYHDVNLDALDGLLAPDWQLTRRSNCAVVIDLQPYLIAMDDESVVIRLRDQDDPMEAYTEL